MSYLIVLMCCLPGMAMAQWRVQVSGGLSTASASRQPEDYYIAAHDQSINPLAGVAVLRQHHSWEYGISAQVMRLELHTRLFYVDSGTVVTYRAIFGQPAVPVTTLVNYGRFGRKSFVYIGGQIGALIALGKEQEDFNTLSGERQTEVHFRSSLGFTGGVQAGYRYRISARADMGLQLQMSYTSLHLRHGTQDNLYDYGVFYLPVQLYAGFRL